MEISFTHAEKVVKAPNVAKVIKALYKQAREQEFVCAGEVSWNRDSVMKVSCYNLIVTISHCHYS